MAELIAPALGAEPAPGPARGPDARRTSRSRRGRRGRRHLRRQRPQEGQRDRPGARRRGSSPTTRAWPSTPSTGAPASTRPATPATTATTRRTTARSSRRWPTSPTNDAGRGVRLRPGPGRPAGTIRLEAEGACRGRITREPSGQRRVRLRSPVPDPRIPQDVRRAEPAGQAPAQPPRRGPSPGSAPALERLIVERGLRGLDGEPRRDSRSRHAPRSERPRPDDPRGTFSDVLSRAFVITRVAAELRTGGGGGRRAGACVSQGSQAGRVVQGHLALGARPRRSAPRGGRGRAVDRHRDLDADLDRDLPADRPGHADVLHSVTWRRDRHRAVDRRRHRHLAADGVGHLADALDRSASRRSSAGTHLTAAR